MGGWCRVSCNGTRVSDLRVVSPHHKNDLLFVPEGLQKYAAFIARVDTASGVIQIPPELRDRLPPGLRKSIVIRECYRTVLKKLEALGNNFAVVLSGTPGIGKSAFAVLLLHHLAGQGAQVAYRYACTSPGRPTL
jgi:Mrp family chromosome partitioning ATPase